MLMKRVILNEKQSKLVRLALRLAEEEVQLLDNGRLKIIQEELNLKEISPLKLAREFDSLVGEFNKWLDGEDEEDDE